MYRSHGLLAHCGKYASTISRHREDCSRSHPLPLSIAVTVPLPTEATTNREELMSYFKLMYTMRRMEITCDTEYKVRPNPALLLYMHT